MFDTLENLRMEIKNIEDTRKPEDIPLIRMKLDQLMSEMTINGLDVDDQVNIENVMDLAYSVHEFSDTQMFNITNNDRLPPRSNITNVRDQLSEYHNSLSRPRNNDDMPSIQLRDPMSDKCKIRLDSGIVKLVGEYTIEIGHTNAKFDLDLDLRADPSVFMSESLPLAGSCLTSRSKSSSPSQILHNTVVFSLAKSILNHEMMIERQAKYTPDILIRHNKGDLSIDVTGSSTRSKLVKISGYYSGIVIVINKYCFLSKIVDHNIIMLARWSKVVDQCDTEYIYQRVCGQSKHFGRKPLVSIKTMNFFKSGTDPIGRSICEHYTSAVRQLTIRANKPVDQKLDVKVDFSPIIEVLEIIHNNPKRCEQYFPYASYQLSVHDGCRNAIFDPSTFNKVIEPENITSTVLDYKLDLIWDGMDKDLDDYVNKKQLFELISSISVHEEAYKAAMDYASLKQSNDVGSAKFMLFLSHILGGVPMAVRSFFMSRVSTHTNYYMDGQGNIKLKTRNLEAQRKLNPCPNVKGIKFEMRQLRVGALSVDPDHHNMCQKMDAKAALAHLAMSTIYHNLRFKARIATAILLYHKPDKCMSVSHYNNDYIHAEVKISGLVLDSDRGVCMVSYFHRNALIRTEKWRLSDIENFSINHHRYVSMVISLYKQKIARETRIEMCDLYGALLLENSWGISKFYKVFKYITYGSIAGSANSETAIKKLKSQIDESFKGKLSSYILSCILLNRIKNNKIEKGKSILFGLDFNLMSYELYLVNLCPQNTYGRKKHLTDTMEELVEETKLYEDNFAMVQESYNLFDDLLESRDLDLAYENYFNQIDCLSDATSGRFTGTPLSIVLMNDEIESLDFRRLDIISQLPHLSELLTARASYDPVNMSCSFAANTIAKLSLEFNTDSTSLLALYLLDNRRLIDITMRMFDKNQVGGNREISILSNEFRILQVVAESFFKGIGMLTDNEMLNRKERYDDMMKIFEKSIDSDSKIMCSIDQTRWGPNFNTSLFGLMALSMSRFTTEAYIPSLVCFLSEFKVFEIPPWLHRLTSSLTSSYSLPGVLGRSHMAQGIFHNTSSVYHSLLTSMFGKMAIESSKIDNPEVVPEGFGLRFDSLITSDDCSMTFSVLLPLRYRMEKLVHNKHNPYLEDLLTSTHRSLLNCVQNYGKIVKYIGIKTSEYKNIVSDDFLEFNSLYLSRSGISEPNLKFLYALVEPQTTGNFLQDYSNVLNGYYTALNCGVGETDAILICYSNYLRFCRQWLIRADITGFPSIESMRYGLMPSLLKSGIDRTHMNLMRTRSYLRHKNRKIFEDVKGFNSTTLSEAYVDLAIRAIDGSRSQSAHRSCITHYQGNRHLLTDSIMYQMFGAYGESFISFLKNNNMDPTHALRCYNNEVEIPYFYASENYITDPKKKFTKIHLKKTRMSNLSIDSLLASLEPAKSTVKCTDTNDDFMRHMIRDTWIGEIIDPIITEQCKGLALSEQVMLLTSLLNNLYMNVGTCSRHIFNPTGKSIGYKCVIIAPPITQVDFDFTLSSFIDKSLPNLHGNVANTKDYCSLLIVASNGSLSQRETVGNYQYDNTVRTPVFISAPSLDDILGSVCMRYVEVNRKYIKPGNKYYLNLLVNTTTFNKSNKDKSASLFVDVPDNDEDFLKMFEDDPYGGANNNLFEFIGKFDDCERTDDQPEEEVDDEKIVCAGATSIVQSMMSDTMIHMSPDNPLYKMVSLEVHQDAVMYTEGYGLCRLITNWFLNELLDLSVLQSSSKSRGYILELIRSGEMKIYCTDKELPHKINQMVRHMSSRFQIEFSNSISDVKNFLYSLASGEPLVDEQSNIVHKAPLMLCSSLYTISTRPEGSLRSKDEIIDIILGENFLPVLFR
uniref:RNA-dependent RNA polymerase n=1 Tax=Jiangxia Mosquito Virus 1 TaxID=1608051 RepID=A0A0B5KKF2_9VIRU|nr:RNA-dependent RNA polymerase [Jiangxia Mosquito Virus 1]